MVSRLQAALALYTVSFWRQVHCEHTLQHSALPLLANVPLSPASILPDRSMCLVLPAELVAAVAPTARHATPLTLPGGELQGRYHAAAIRCVGI